MKGWFNRREFLRLMRASYAPTQVAGLHPLIIKIIDAGESFRESSLSEAEMKLLLFEADRSVEEAKREWTIKDCYISGIMDNCNLCDHEIREVFVIRNAKNGNTLKVGNVCISLYMLINGLEIQEEIEELLHNCSLEAQRKHRASEFAKENPEFKAKLIDVLDNLCEYDPSDANIRKMHAEAMKDIDIIARQYKTKKYLTPGGLKKFFGIYDLLEKMREMRKVA